MNRCAWVKHAEEIVYHDAEWCVTSTDERYLFEMLILEGMQAGLSWITILRKRDNYHRQFHKFNTTKIIAMTDAELLEILADENAGIIRNRNKVFSIRSNAGVFEDVQRKHGSFYAYIWSFIPNGKKIINDIQKSSDVAAQTELSRLISKDMKKLGFKFVGPVIVYSYLQAIGIIDDHENDCIFKTKNIL